ncbi:MAG: endonuclease/exonuclease/phosphatase family protein [Deltaproteobacteria bacterium]|nr:endonuclease/exonuclease/phosphatase family protein [Deltaproteobacteria bacterium]
MAPGLFQEGPLSRLPQGMLPASVVTLNLWGEQGPWPRRLELVGDSLLSLGADIVALQEVRDVPGKVPNQAATLAARLGFHHVYAPATPWGGGDEGVALLSRWPLGEVRRLRLPHAVPLETRLLLSAVVTTPVGPVGLHTTHLNYRMTDGDKRAAQLHAIDLYVRAYSEAGDHPQLLCGDLNAAPGCDEIRFMRGRHSLAGRRTYWQDAWESRHPDHAGDPGWTWCEANSFTAPLGWLERDRRIDYVLVGQERKDGRGRVLDARVVLDQPVGGVWPSDHYGVLAVVALGPQPAPPAAPAPPPPPPPPPPPATP